MHGTHGFRDTAGKSHRPPLHAWRFRRWQLDPVNQQLTQAVLQEVEGIDCWTLYRALSESPEGLGGRSPVEAVTADSINDVALAVFNVLGFH